MLALEVAFKTMKIRIDPMISICTSELLSLNLELRHLFQDLLVHSASCETFKDRMRSAQNLCHAAMAGSPPNVPPG